MQVNFEVGAMFSLSSFIRVYIVLSIVIMISFFTVLTTADVLLEPIWQFAPNYLESIFRNLYVAVIIMALLAIVYGVIIALFVYNRGLNKYQDFLRRLDNIQEYSTIRPAMIRFPDQDEFGNLGEKLNEFMTQIDYYDQTKTSFAQIEKEKFLAITSRVDFPILLINTESNEPYVSYYNNVFRDTFLKKSIFIDHYGKPQTQYYNLNQTPIVHMTIRNKEHTPFFDEKQMDKMTNRSIVLDKEQKYFNITFSDIAGEKLIEFEELICIPLNSNVEKIMSQMLYLFLKPKTPEKKTFTPNT